MNYFYLYIFLLCLGACLVSCQEREVDFVYQLNQADVSASEINKNQEKTLEQYISILHANLFQKALSADELVELRDCMTSIGDKELGKQMIVSNFMNHPAIILPTKEDMRTDIDKFIKDTFRRFLIREPTEAELAYFRNLIQRQPGITPELVFTAFAMSDEYRYY
ncbi:MAG: hypothetical protein AAF587_26800 [Bacteroidota bacterium]